MIGSFTGLPDYPGKAGGGYMSGGPRLGSELYQVLLYPISQPGGEPSWRAAMFRVPAPAVP